MNRVLKTLIFSDILIWSGVSFLSPIIAIFINDRLIGGSVFTAGMATTVAYLVRAAILVPVGRYNDRDRGNRREFATLLIGVFIMSAVPLSYIFINRIEYFFTAQMVYGIGLALYYPGWLTIWTRFVDGFHEGQSWAIYGALTSAAIAIAAFVGGYVAFFLSFNAVFVMVAVFGAISLIIIYLAKEQIYGWPKTKGRGNRARLQ